MTFKHVGGTALKTNMTVIVNTLENCCFDASYNCTMQIESHRKKKVPPLSILGFYVLGDKNHLALNRF